MDVELEKIFRCSDVAKSQVANAFTYLAFSHKQIS